MAHLTKRPAAEVVIRRPDGTEDRIVRQPGKELSDSQLNAADMQDEDYRLVAECAPYTASFNNLLEMSRPDENPQRFVTLVHDRMHAEGIPMNTKTYNLLMKRMVRYSNGVIFALYEELKAEGTKPSGSVAPDVETFRLLFRACERGAQYSRAFVLHQQMRDIFNLLPDTSTYNALLGYCAAARDVAQASYLVHEMKAHQVELDVNTFNCLMSSLVDTAPYQETLRVFYELADYHIKPTNRTYNTVLKAACRHDDYDRVFQLFEEMKKRGLIPDVSTYNTLLSVCEKRLDYIVGCGRYAGVHRTRDQIVHGKTALAELALTLLSEMEAIHVVPNTFGYNRVLTVLLECEDVRIFTVYQKVLQAYELHTAEVDRKRQLERRKNKKKLAEGNTDAKVGNSSPQVLSEEEVRIALEEAMRSEDPQDCGSIHASGVHPNIETYMIMMRACQRLGYPGKCEVLYRHMLTNSIYLHRDMTLLALDICAETLNKTWANEIMQEAKRLRLLIDSTLFNRYMAVLAALKDAELFSHFEEMKLGINEFGAKANTETYNIVLRGYLEQQLPEVGIELYESMNTPYAKVAPDDVTYCLMIDLCALLRDLERPTTLVEGCIKAKQLLSVQVFHHLFRLYCDLQASLIEDLFARMKHPGQDFLPNADVECYTMVMRYYLAQKRYDEISSLFDEIKTSHTREAEPATYEVMFAMYHERTNRRAIVALFDDARMNSVKLTVETYNIVIRTFVGTSDPFIFDVLLDMKTNCMAPADSTMAILMGSTEGRHILAEAVAQHLVYRPTLSCGF